MGYAARKSQWRLHAPWQGIPQGHAGQPFGLLSVLISGLEDGQQAEIDLGVGLAGAQQEFGRMVVRGNGEAILPKPQNFRAGAVLWFRANISSVVVATKTAAILPAEQELVGARATEAIGNAFTALARKRGITLP